VQLNGHRSARVLEMSGETGTDARNLAQKDVAELNSGGNDGWVGPLTIQKVKLNLRLLDRVKGIPKDAITRLI
jgi:hypothetical protein